MVSLLCIDYNRPSGARTRVITISSSKRGDRARFCAFRRNLPESVGFRAKRGRPEKNVTVRSTGMCYITILDIRSVLAGTCLGGSYM